MPLSGGTALLLVSTQSKEHPMNEAPPPPTFKEEMKTTGWVVLSLGWVILCLVGISHCEQSSDHRSRIRALESKHWSWTVKNREYNDAISRSRALAQEVDALETGLSTMKNRVQRIENQERSDHYWVYPGRGRVGLCDGTNLQQFLLTSKELRKRGP